MDDRIEADIDRLLDGFASLLADVEVSEDLFLDREVSTRSPVPVPMIDGFRVRILANAPSSDGERILAERRSW